MSKKNKNILFVNSSLSGGGSEKVMCLLANKFADLDYNVTMVLVREFDDDIYEVHNNVTIVRFHYFLNNKIFKFVNRLFLLRNYIKKNDYIISFMSDINICTLIAGFFLNKKIIVSERADPSQPSHSRIVSFLENVLYPMAYKVVLQTNYVKSLFSSKIASKSVVIPNPITSNLPVQRLADVDNVIVAAGRLVEQKNFELLINSFSKFVKNNDQYKLIIYGEGQLRNKLERYIEKLNLEGKVFLPGYVKNVNELMKCCKMYISSSNFEGISNSMIEAMAMGIPSICTDCPVGGARLMIRNNVNGILIPVGDEIALIKAMNKIANDSDFARRLSKESLKVREEYSINKIIKRWEELL